MFIGHYAVAFFSKGQFRLPPLWLMFVAVQLLDLLWPIFVLLGVESFAIEPGNTALTPLNFTFYPYSHSLFMAIVWGSALGLTYYFFRKDQKASILVFFLVISHWILDYLSHRPDLQLWPFSEKRVGLGLWNHPVWEVSLELLMFIVGSIVYFLKVNPTKKFSFLILAALFIIIHLANVFGSPPPSVSAVAWSANFMWIFVLWAWWIERPKKIIVRL